MTTEFNFKKREEISPDDQAVYDSAEKQLGFVPNMYRIIANSDHALSRYVRAEFSRSTLSSTEQEIINLVVSEVNGCQYCIRFHYTSLQKSGFTAEQLAAVRNGGAYFDTRLNALIRLVKEITEKRGHIEGSLVDDFVAAGYTKNTVIDTIILINLRGVTNYVHAALGEFEIDFPPVPPLI